MDILLKCQDMTQDEKVKLYDQPFNVIWLYHKRMHKPVRVSIVPPKTFETKETEE